MKYVFDKFRHKLPKEELKRLAKDVNKKLAASDYKNRRVQDPTAALQESQSRKIKAFVKTFLDKAVAKYAESQAPVAEPSEGANGVGVASQGAADKGGAPAAMVTPDVDTTPELGNGASPGSPGLKRKRERQNEAHETPVSPADEDEHLAKRARDLNGAPPPPPPPPPPPETEEEKDRRVQELDLMRENEEAQRMEDEAKES
ncbi:hypothetical protein IMZ48_44495 [Candidatus Bathyarchaeota archaeon]|nr:hypothetical protein [Candidatus Bathyarchaeota archaeon]